MGLTLTRTAKWYNNKRNLSDSAVNEYILTEIAKFIEEFPNKFPNEANFFFKAPLEWTSDIYNENHFKGSDYTIK